MHRFVPFCSLVPFRTHSLTNNKLFVMLHRNRRQTAHCNTIETAAARGHTQRCNVEISYFSPAAGKLLPHWELAKRRERTNCRWKIIFARLPSGFFFLACNMVTVCECAQKEEMLMGVHNIIIIEIARAADGAFTRFALVDRV